MKTRTFAINRSRTGLPVITESGGGMTNTGSCKVIANRNGDPVKPLFVPRGYSNADHALFVARKGMLIARASHDRGGYSVNIYRIIDIREDEVEAELVFGEENGDGDIPPHLHAMRDAALDKSHCYHCREPHYIK